MGIGAVTGIVKVADAPASNSIVRAYDRDTGALVGETTCDLDGTFYIYVPDDTRKYVFTAINNLFPGFNAGIKDNVEGTPALSSEIVTSGIYPPLNIDEMRISSSFVSADLIQFFDADKINISTTVETSLVATIIYFYHTVWPEDKINISTTVEASLVATITYFYYTVWPEDKINISSNLVSTDLTIVISYSYVNIWPEDKINISCSFIGATLV